MNYPVALYLITLIFSPLLGYCQNQTMGLLINTPESYNGYTLFSNNEYSYLVDNCGIKVNEWESDYKVGQSLYLMENGDLLRQGALFGDFDAGGRGGIFELYDWSGNLKWQYRIANDLQHAHHDIAILPSGNFLCTVWERKSQSQAQNYGRKYDGEVWSATILEIEILPNNQANIVWKWSVWDHLIQDYNPSRPNYGIVADHPELIDINYIGEDEETSENWLHLNAISYNESLDQIAISSRNLSEIYIIDHSTTTAEAMSHSGGKYGKGGDILFRYGNPQVYDHGDASHQILHKQHHIDWIPDESTWSGGFSVFNNKYEANQSSIIIFNNPANENGVYHFDSQSGYGDISIVREYTTTGFYSDIQSGVQILANDHLLLLEGRSGHITEVGADDNVVWEYINPVNRNGGPGIQGGTPQFNSLFRAIRYSPDFEGFDGKTLLPTVPIELSPIPSSCEIYETFVSTKDIIDKLINVINIYGNPIGSTIEVENLSEDNIQAKIFGISGRLYQELSLYPGLQTVEINLPKGMYYLISKEQKVKFVHF